MTITSSVTEKYDNNYVRVEITENKLHTRAFKLPESQADSFQEEYKKNSKKSARRSNIDMLLGLLGATLLAYLGTKKMENQALKNITAIAAGIAGGIGGTIAAALIGDKNYRKLLYKYNATEVEPKIAAK